MLYSCATNSMLTFYESCSIGFRCKKNSAFFSRRFRAWLWRHLGERVQQRSDFGGVDGIVVEHVTGTGRLPYSVKSRH
jgi:L-asparaginase/Glu-tRNA(Gln) amidotransferase subunit D